ncbi:hypothetical protein GCM10007298_14420 [Williamsia phyllosphaerae]|uniref:Uncharacterized protein n=1 Tax=Williamsia phyllosphaerae TaxID=885042 RepID=A0ABQ1UHY3_9NOCA|nr:hypothetical protein GCM10007298_14420 [Williamsia phyllosphaerae]
MDVLEWDCCTSELVIVDLSRTIVLRRGRVVGATRVPVADVTTSTSGQYVRLLDMRNSDPGIA